MKTDAEYPRTLIIGESFDRFTGGGITLRNLFSGWPLDRIAVAAARQDFTDWDSCSRYYRLGRNETKGVWPIYRSSRALPSGPVQPINSLKIEDLPPAVSTNEKHRSVFRRMASASMSRLGVSELLTDSCVSPEFLEWVRAFFPEVIYSQLGSISAIRFVKQLVFETQLPLVVHVMDDWAKYLYTGLATECYLRRILDKEFRDLLHYTTRRLGICQDMCDAYQVRYGGDWLPFHNPVELSVSQSYARKEWKSGSPFRILYGGRIGRGIWNSLLAIGCAVSELVRSGADIVFEIRTPDQKFSVAHKLKALVGVKVMPPLSYDKVSANLASADLLVIPYDFDEYSATSSRLSMPTKTAEYMSSGTPILIYAPNDFAITQYALAQQWGMIVDQPGILSIKSAILALMNDEKMRERFGSQAKLVAENNHSGESIRELFRQALTII